jgi:hypothetical protein
MPACSSQWEAQQGDGIDEAQSGAAWQGFWGERKKVAAGEMPARFSHAKPVSNRHHEELAR